MTAIVLKLDGKLDDSSAGFSLPNGAESSYSLGIAQLVRIELSPLYSYRVGTKQRKLGYFFFRLVAQSPIVPKIVTRFTLNASS
jgi:hypothetical protein